MLSLIITRHGYAGYLLLAHMVRININLIKKLKPIMKKISFISFISLLILQFATAGTIKVVTTTTDMKSITEMIGGNKVSVTSIATGYQNPHFVDPKPSYIISLSNADMFVTIGLDLETGWSPQLLSSSRNPKIQKGSNGYVDASIGVTLMQV